MATDKRIFFATDLEERFGIPQSTWRYWAYIGRGPRSYRLGRRRVWDRSDVEAWLAQQRSAEVGPDDRTLVGEIEQLGGDL